MPSKYSLHVQKWKEGCGADICERAKQVCFARGSIPCDVLFIGEAPGLSEDVMGQPFVGPAGHLIDRIIRRSFAGLEPSPVYALTNLVGCVPKRDQETAKKKYGQPSSEDIQACAPRLQEFVDMCRPSLIVCVGAMARDWLARGYKNPVKIPRTVPMIDIVHPAHILKMNIAMRGFTEQKCVITIREAIEEIEENTRKLMEEINRVDRITTDYTDDIPF
jgi:uracil-DNA glycosylase family 4